MRRFLILPLILILVFACEKGTDDGMLPRLADPYVLIQDPDFNQCIKPGESLSFRAEGEDVATYEWNFGDPTIPNVSGETADDVIFPNTGNFMVTITSTGHGKTVTDQVLVVVRDDCLTLVIDSPLDGAEFEVGEQVQFNVIASGGEPPYTYEWYFDYDGCCEFQHPTIPSESELQNPIHAFGSPGSTPSEVWVTDASGYEDAQNVYVNIVDPVASGCDDIMLTITFPDGLTEAPAGFVNLTVPGITVFGQDGWNTFKGDDCVRWFNFGDPFVGYLGGLCLASTEPSPSPASGGVDTTYTVFAYDSGGPRICTWINDENRFGFCQLILTGSVFDAAAYNDDPTSGGFTYANANTIWALEFSTGFYRTTSMINSARFPGKNGNFASAFARGSSGAMLVATVGGPGERGQLYIHDRVNSSAEATFVDSLGITPRQLRVMNNVFVVSNFESGTLTVGTWDAGTTVNVVAEIPVGDGPVGIDLLDIGGGNIAIVSTGFNDASYSITVVSATGTLVSNTKTAAGGTCAQPAHAIWMPSGDRSFMMSCFGSDEVVVIDSGL
jgi:hypothetical protein